MSPPIITMRNARSSMSPIAGCVLKRGSASLPTAVGSPPARTAPSILRRQSQSQSCSPPGRVSPRTQRDPSNGEIEHPSHVENLPYDRLRERHITDHQRLFRRTRLKIGDQKPSTIATDQRLAAFRTGATDLDLLALYFQYGRYLLIASSRPGSQAANLQGIWNDRVRPPWSSNWTTNINTEMNYWPAEVTNLAECHQPLFELITDLSVAGRRTAHDYYGARGWTAHHNVDLWRSSWPVGGGTGNPVWTCWPMSGVWMCQHLWEHYAYTGDRAFLADRGYPAMKGAARFALDFLIEGPEGRLVTCPSTSPENQFRTSDGAAVAVSAASTMDVWLIRDLFDNCIAATTELGVDEEFADELRSVLQKLWRPRIAPDGRLQEWQ